MFPGKSQSQSQSNQAAAQGQPLMLAGQSSSSSTASATTALEEDVVEKQLIAQIHAAKRKVRAQVMVVAGEPMTEESTSEFNKLLKACLAVRNAQAALGEHYASHVAVSSAFSFSGFTVPPSQHPLDPFAAATSCDLTDVVANGASNSVALPPLQRATAALDGIVDNELLAAAAAASASGDLTAATGIEDLENDDAPVSPTPDSSSSSSSLAPGTHVAGPRQALAAAPTAQQATPPAPPASESKSHP